MKKFPRRPQLRRLPLLLRLRAAESGEAASRSRTGSARKIRINAGAESFQVEHLSVVFYVEDATITLKNEEGFDIKLICFRTFNYRNVASLMCECTPNCLEVATLYGTGLYNMQGRDLIAST